jgi:hypothetical protein
MNANNDNQAVAQWAHGLLGNQPLQTILAGATDSPAAQAAAQPVATRVMTDFGKIIPKLEVGSGRRFGNLDWFPVWIDSPVKLRRYITRANANVIRVNEFPDANVGALQITNDSRHDMLLLAGTLIEAGWQHRALTRSILVKAQSRTELPVVCVEAGRWGGAQAQRLGQRLAPARVKTAMRGLRRNGVDAVQSNVDQQRVWDEVHGYSNRHGVALNTGSYVELRDRIEPAWNLSQDEIQPVFGQRGVIIAIGGQPVALELFDHPKTLQERMDEIVRSYLPDAMNQPYVETPSRRARRFAAAVNAAGIESREVDGRYRNAPHQVVASELIINEGALLHLSTLNAKHELVLAA